MWNQKRDYIMKLKWLIYPLRIFYILLLVVGACSVPVLIVVIILTPILDIFCYIATGKFRIMEAYCDWFFGEYPECYLDYLKPENILEKIEIKYNNKD